MGCATFPDIMGSIRMPGLFAYIYVYTHMQTHIYIYEYKYTYIIEPFGFVDF